MMDINVITLIGRLVHNPESKTHDDLKIVNFSIANNYNKEQVNFFDVTVFGKLAENCSKYLSKGSKIGLVGRLQYNKYTNKSGENRTRIKIIASHVEFLDTKHNDNNDNNDNDNNDNNYNNYSDQVPF